MEELVDIDEIIKELEAWLACDVCGEIAYGTAYEDVNGEDILSCGRPGHGKKYEPFAQDNGISKTRNNLLQIANRCKYAEETLERIRTQQRLKEKIKEG